ncbi:putative clathrin assembly protein At4g40080 [Gastrolobium bilobum]|uniref:putative clathrin assembly protein At4g40080 n=1 Tax=Gastrolobium bilobum TaxID=150636 RepID=UPI002AB03D32|nr:putative clathrin assembly protein At4g40080 [Gastrolobium bilobum]
MSLRKRLRNLAHNLKDKASVFAAALSIKRHVSSARVHVLRATTHSLSTPPSEARVAAVLSAGQGSHLLPRACINALMDRLHRTQSATVALKCLFMLHNVMAKGPFTLKDHLSHYPSNGGHNFLNLSTFRDHSDLETLELSSWVRWYAGVLEHVITVSRVLGYYLSSSLRDSIKRVCLGVSSGDLLYKIQGLVVFVEHVSHVPESLHLQKNDLVYELVRLVGEDYGSVQREILLRVEEIGERVGNLDVGELRELVGYLERLEETKERLQLLFVNRKKNNGFWDLIDRTKAKAVAVVEEREGKWLTVVRRGTTQSGSTRFTNPFLDPGQLIPVPPSGGWPGVN